MYDMLEKNKDNELIEVRGAYLTIVLFKGAIKTFDKSMKRIKDKHTVATRLKVRKEHLVKTGELNVPNQYNVECDLPDGATCWAIKSGNIRAYGWYSKKVKNCFVISHYVYKDYQKMKKADKDKVIRNYKKFEGI